MVLCVAGTLGQCPYHEQVPYFGGILIEGPLYVVILSLARIEAPIHLDADRSHLKLQAIEARSESKAMGVEAYYLTCTCIAYVGGVAVSHEFD